MSQHPTDRLAAALALLLAVVKTKAPEYARPAELALCDAGYDLARLRIDQPNG
jgi:hypothetical protein